MRSLEVSRKTSQLAVVLGVLIASGSTVSAQTLYQTQPEVPIGFTQSCAGEYAVKALKSNKLNIRNGPETKYRAIGWLVSNQSIHIVDCKGNWLGIRDPQSAEQIGWVHKEFVQRI